MPRRRRRRHRLRNLILLLLLAALIVYLFPTESRELAETAESAVYELLEEVGVIGETAAENTKGAAEGAETAETEAAEEAAESAETVTELPDAETLNEDLYQGLYALAVQTAASGGSTVLTYEFPSLTIETETYEEYIAQAEETLNGIDYNLDTVITRLMQDCPYELYWFDKTSSADALITADSSDIKVSRSWDGTESHSGTVTYTMTVTLSVSQDYQDVDSASPSSTVDPEKAAAATQAAAAAQAIVAEYAGLGDREKLAAYRDRICALTSYNREAAAANSSGSYGDAWQLTYVFDGDESTSVVCEGYAKAFQYLCSLSTFQSEIACYTITGTMIGGTGAGDHMWNLVSIDGSSYLVDVTNSDSGSVGANGGLFLATGSGSAADGYSFSVGGMTVTYCYSEWMLSYFGETLLTLAAG